MPPLSRSGNRSRLTQGGRAWPQAEAYDGALNVSGYSVEGFADADANQLRLSNLFTHLPAAVLKAKVVGAAKPAKKLGSPNHEAQTPRISALSAANYRALIAAFAASANRCNSHGNVTSTRT